MKGYSGQILIVDLESNLSQTFQLTDEQKRNFIGGTALGVYLFYRFGKGDNLPLHPQNPLIFTTGPLTGTIAPASGRYAVVSRSPLTGIWGEGDSGGRFGINLKAAGYDALVIIGKASSPVYLWVDEEKVEVRDANKIWGKDTYEASRLIVQETSQKASVACIGLAGEKVVPLACIISEGRHARAVGRCGLGAVMGAKNLKGVAVSGSKRIEVAYEEKLRSLVQEVVQEIKKKGETLHKLGTAGSLLSHAFRGEMSAKNWQLGSWSEAEKISGEALKETFFVERGYACPRCIIGCGRRTLVPKGRYKGEPTAGPEYETLAGFGGQCLVSDPAVIIEAQDLCNRYGLDIISTSGVIAFAMEAAEKGLLRVEGGDIPRIIWGNGEAVVFLIDQIAKQEGIGALLGQGVKNAAEALGPEAGQFAVHVKGLELPYHDPRAVSSVAVAYATQARGGCHRGCAYNIERFGISELGYAEPLDRYQVAGKGAVVAKMQDYAELFNSLKICHFTMRSIQPLKVVECLNFVTGEEFSLGECLKVGERSTNLKRLFNLKWGLSRGDDSLPPRILKEPFQEGESAYYRPDLETMLKEYYQSRGWDENGVPFPEKLYELGIHLFFKYDSGK